MTNTVQGEAAVEGAVHRSDAAVEAEEPVRLAEILDRAEAAPLLARLIERRGRSLTLDASPVRRVGGQCLQVLMSAAATWSTDALPFAVADCSQEFIAGVALFGVDPQSLWVRQEMNGAAS